MKIGYGPATLKRYFTPWAYEGFDGFLVHGKLETAKFYPYFDKNRIFVIGMPKYDSVYPGSMAKEELRKRYGIPSNAKVVTYLPTWDEECSVERFHNALKDLRSSGYTLVIKPHPHSLTSNHQTHFLDALKLLDAILLDCYEPLTHAALVADVLVTDVKSGATLESIYLSKAETPWIGLIQKASDSEFHSNILQAGPILRQPNLLVSTVNSLVELDNYKEKRKALLPLFCGESDGKNAKRAANALLAIGRLPCISKNYPYFWKKLVYSLEKKYESLKSFLFR